MRQRNALPHRHVSADRDVTRYDAADMTEPRGDFDSITQNDPLVAALRQRIAANGPITFRDFMATVLYDQQHGYYATHTRAMSRAGDYVSSPEVHSIFGALVAKQIAEMWEHMSRPPSFDIVEQGAGTGALARDIIRWARGHEPEFAAALRYRIVETMPRAQAEQKRTLADIGGEHGVVWCDALPAGIAGCVFSNELVDAFPVHRVVRQGDDLREVYVSCDTHGHFVDDLRPLSPPALQRYFDDLGMMPGEGSYAEINLDAIAWMRAAASSLSRGYVLTFDYGYEAASLYAPWRRDGTLLCFYRQTASSDPYQRIGEQDMTSSVDFTTLRREGESAGLATIATTDQAEFLVRMGITEGIASIAAERPAEMEEYFARRNVVMALIDPARLGRVRVMLQSKGVTAAPLRGFSATAT